MNAADFIIIGVVVLLALAGLRSGILKPVSGIGGLILGIVLAMHYSDHLAPQLAKYIEGETLQRVAAFAAIVLFVAIATRISAAMVKKLLSHLVLGWVDHVAGAAGGVVLGVVLAGTIVYLLVGADFAPTRQALAASKLAPEISRVTLISAVTPWCSSSQDGAPANGEACTDMKGLVNQFLGRDISEKVNDMLGQDAGPLAGVVESALKGTPQEIVGLVESDRVNDVLGEDAGKLAEAAQGALNGLTQEVENLVSTQE